jgi:uncharacterized ion transporter superfamily protein YfcC
MNSNKQVTIGKKAFLTSAGILLALMICAGLLTLFVPAGSYERVLADGRETIIPDSFRIVGSAHYPVWRWFTAPVEVLGSKDNTVIITIIVFLLFIGGSIAVLNSSGVLTSILGGVVRRFSSRKYRLMAVLVFLFMSMGAVIGMFEEVVPLIPIFVVLSWGLGWDSLTGLGIVLLSTGFGFAAAVTNPFTIGIAQKIAGLPMFSGLFYRAIIFLMVYGVLFLFLRAYARRIEKTPSLSPVHDADLQRRDISAEAPGLAANPSMKRAVAWFAGCMALMLGLLVAGAFIPAISEVSLPLVGLMFLIGGLGAGLFSKMGPGKTMREFGQGCLALAPAILLILMASSIRHIITGAGILDTILHALAGLLQGSHPFIAVVIVYGLVLLMELFIGSGSAKAFLIMPIIVPLADIIGVNRQIMVLAFQFGDGFSNLLYPTNPVLLIGLGLTVVSYTKWFKWVIKLQGIVFLMTLAMLEIALLAGYGPF